MTTPYPKYTLEDRARITRKEIIRITEEARANGVRTNMSFRFFDHVDLGDLNLDGVIFCGSIFDDALFGETSVVGVQPQGCFIDADKNTTLRNTDLMWSDMYDLVGRATMDKATEDTLATCK